MGKLYQQGDILLLTAEIPASAQPRQGLILATGETTRHAHRAVGELAELYGLISADRRAERLFLRAPHGVKILHEEHAPVTLPPGDYEVGIVREFDPFAEEVRKVRD